MEQFPDVRSLPVGVMILLVTALKDIDVDRYFVAIIVSAP
jgi:hypothetical protein